MSIDRLFIHKEDYKLKRWDKYIYYYRFGIHFYIKTQGNMLSIQNLSVNIGEKQILDKINADFQTGKNYCILGKNGSGKSTLGMTIAGHPSYEITNGQIILKSENNSDIYINELGPDERAKLGIFIAMQSIPEIPGVKLFEFLRQIYNSKFEKTESFVSFKKIIEPMIAELGIDKEFLWRDLNVGFSGGERRKIEILQLKLLQPKIIILDEVDSGLDVDAFRAVAKLLGEYDDGDNTFVVVTHYFQILDYISVDEVILMSDGKVIDKGGVEMINKVKEGGFEELVK